jgi:predicted ATPase
VGLLPLTHGPPDPTGRLVTALTDRELLLILDNCEHVVDAAARLTRRLLGGCPDLRGPGHQPGGARHHG